MKKNETKINSPTKKSQKKRKTLKWLPKNQSKKMATNKKKRGCIIKNNKNLIKSEKKISLKR